MLSKRIHLQGLRQLDGIQTHQPTPRKGQRAWGPDWSQMKKAWSRVELLAYGPGGGGVRVWALNPALSASQVKWNACSAQESSLEKRILERSLGSGTPKTIWLEGLNHAFTKSIPSPVLSAEGCRGEDGRVHNKLILQKERPILYKWNWDRSSHRGSMKVLGPFSQSHVLNRLFCFH